MKMCSGPSFLVSVFPSSYLALAFFLPEKKTTFHTSYCRWCWNNLSSSGLCPTSSSFYEPVTQHTSCPAALLFLLLLSPALPPHSSTCLTSDLIRTSFWPLGLLFSCHLISPRAPPSFSRVGTLSSSLNPQLSVCTTVCARACCMPCCYRTGVWVCVSIKVSFLFQTSF